LCLKGTDIYFLTGMMLILEVFYSGRESLFHCLLQSGQ
jgi:hypothetical protein